MKLNVAVTSAGSSPAVAVIKALRKQEDITMHITALDMNAASSGMYLADSCFTIPPSHKPGFIESVIKLCRKHGIQCLIPIIDEELFVFADNKNFFDRSGIKLIVNNKDTIRLAKNKYLTQKFCIQEGILAPKAVIPADIDKAKKLDYPLIMKPQDGRGSADVVRINDKNELSFYKRHFQGSIIQQFIEGKEYTIDIVASCAGEILQAVPRERIAVKAGMSYKGRTTKDSKLIDYGKAVAKKFRIDGPANIQCIVNKNGIYLIEVNPKFSAGLPLTVASGVNIPLILIKLAFNLSVEKNEFKFKDGIYMFRFWEEIFVAQEKLFN